ncbi:MAG: hypothetical protein LQ340_000681 [Diploschistes diacapsis]|nr:MAG: hypothetical protein LQ340_000681 [Diploschistes diacapsis]
MKGLDTGLNEIDYFTTVEEMAECYVNHIKAYQPQRPYTIAGYSLGTTVAFEIAKRPEANQNEVAFLGLFDSPPYIAELIQHLDWVDVLLVNVAYFLELINENYSMVLQTDLQAVDFILAGAPQDKLRQLELNMTRLQKLVEVTDAFRRAGKEWSPKGTVKKSGYFLGHAAPASCTHQTGMDG